MKHFINLKDIPAKDLRKIITDAKKRKSLNGFISVQSTLLDQIGVKVN